jgi:membrane fusion protein (multidrug efflux system)
MMLTNSGMRLLLRASVLLVLMMVAACGGQRTREEKREKYPVIFPLVKDTTYVTDYVASIQSIQNIDIRAKADGYMEAIHIDEGTYVQQGQLLFTIGSQQYRQELLKAQAALSSAVAEAKASEVELGNARKLVEKKIVSTTELDLAQARYEAMKAKIEEAKAHEQSAELQLSFARVKAPFSGFVNRIPNKVGSLIEKGTLLTTLSDNHEVFAYFNVSEKEYLNFIARKDREKKNEVQLILSNDELHPYKGKIETIESEIDRSTGNLAFRARFPNPDLILKNGATGRVQLLRDIRNALLVPQKSTFEIQDNLYVYVVGDDHKASLRHIKPLLRIPHFYIVGEGLSPEDKIIFEGIQRIKAGDLVEPEQVAIHF